MINYDNKARKLGAIYYYDSFYPAKIGFTYELGHFIIKDRLFARHYFNSAKLEIAYVIPDLKNDYLHEVQREWPNLPKLVLL